MSRSLVADRALADQASEARAHLSVLMRDGHHPGRRRRLGLRQCLREPDLASLAALEPEIAQLVPAPYVGPAGAAWLAAD